MPSIIAQNATVINPTAKNAVVINPKAQNISAINLIAQNQIILGETKIYQDNRTFAVGQPIPLGGLVLSYPVAGTWTNANRL